MAREAILEASSRIRGDFDWVVSQLCSYIVKAGVTGGDILSGNDAFVDAMDKKWEAMGLPTWSPADVEQWKLDGKIDADLEDDWLTLTAAVHNALTDAVIAKTAR